MLIFFFFFLNQVDSENLSSHPYTLLPALKESFFSDITFTASNGEKVINASLIMFCCYYLFYNIVDLFNLIFNLFIFVLNSCIMLIIKKGLFPFYLSFSFKLTRQFFLVSLLMSTHGTEFLLFLRICLQMCFMHCYTTCMLVLCQVTS